MKAHDSTPALFIPSLIRSLLALLLLPLFSASEAGATEHFVTANPNLTFTPAELAIVSGDTVTWTNDGGLHNAQADDGSFRCANGCDDAGGNGDPAFNSWQFSRIFTATGEVPYFCVVHGAAGGIGMSGVITVPEPTSYCHSQSLKADG